MCSRDFTIKPESAIDIEVHTKLASNLSVTDPHVTEAL